MAGFRTLAIEEFARELALAPARYRAGYLDAARRVLRTLNAEQDYPRSFIVFQITGYRTRQATEIDIGGADLIADLVLLIEQVSLASELPLPRGDDSQDAAGLCVRWSISSKTLDRWRALGLVACWRQGADGPRRLLFSRDDVEWFERTHAERVERARAYRRLDDPGRRALARRAMELIAGGCSLSEATHRVADESGRACETIRLAVHRYREELTAESPEIAPADATEADRAIATYRTMRGGIGATVLAERCGRPVEMVQAESRRGRIAALTGEPIRYIYNTEFDHPAAEQMIFAEPADAEADAAPVEPPAGLPAYLRELYRVPLLTPAGERSLFRRYNYLLHRAEQARRFIDAAAPSEAALDHIETLLARAAAMKNDIIRANLRLVISIARRHLGRATGWDLFDLASEGNTALIRSVEAFDVSRGNKFSTYATWAITRHFARVVSRECAHGDRFRSGGESIWSVVEDAPQRTDAAAEEQPDPRAQRVLAELLRGLDPREREIVERRYGLAEREPQTLLEVSEAVNLSRERVRQIEKRTLEKLRGAMVERGVAALV